MVIAQIRLKEGPYEKVEMDPTESIDALIATLKMSFTIPAKHSVHEWVLVKEGSDLLQGSSVYLSSSDLETLQDKEKLVFLPKPDSIAESHIQGLQSGEAAKVKNSVFALKTDLLDRVIAHFFIEKGGIQHLKDSLTSTSGSGLAYAIAAYEIALQHSYSWNEALDMVSLFVSKLPTPNQTVSRACLQILVNFITHRQDSINDSSETHAIAQHNVVAVAEKDPWEKASPEEQTRYTTIRKELEESENGIGQICQFVSLPNVDLQTQAIRLINALVKFSPSSDLDAIMDSIEAANFRQALSEQLSVQEGQFKAELVLFLIAKVNYSQRRKSISYDKENPEHEELLLRLWNTVFPDNPLENRVTSQWGDLGFQGKDPATDFRGLGIFGLECIIYYLDNYPSECISVGGGKGLFRIEASKTDGTDYPTAITMIQVCNMLISLLVPSASALKDILAHPEPEANRLSILLDHKDAFKEIFCIIAKTLDVVWHAMNARYMDFKNVSTSVTNMISDVLVSEPKSIENFRKMAEMKSKLDKKGGGVLSIEEDLTTAEAQLILASATEEKEAVVLQQRKQSVQIPRSFVISGNRTKERTMRVNADGTHLEYSQVLPIGNPGPVSFDFSIALSSIELISMGPAEASSQVSKKDKRKTAALKISEAELALVFTLQLKDDATDPDSGSPFIEVMCPDEYVLSEWSDGLRAHLDLPMETAHTKTFISALSDFKTRLELIEKHQPTPPKLPYPLPEEILNKIDL